MTSFASHPLRWLGRLGLLAFLVLAGTSFVPVDSFVATGDYARARALAADCSQSFAPALRPEDRHRAESPAQFASLSVRPAGAELAYIYRQLDRVDVRHDIRDVVDVGSSSSDASFQRFDSFEGPSTAVSVTTGRAVDGTCTRLIIRLNPATIRVGRKGTTVPTNLNLELFEGLAPEGYTGGVTIEEIEPGQGEVVVKAYQDGEPVQDLEVTLKTGAPGIPGRYGATIGHEHLASGASDLGPGVSPATPTIRIDGQGSPGQEVVAVTDFEGEIRFNVYAGYRGGPEVIEAHATIGDEEHAVARSVVVKPEHSMTHFTRGLGYEETPAPSPQFPFVLTGWTDRHYYNHWIRAGKAQQIVSTLKTVWTQDTARAAATRDSETGHYIALNDMSLEYGGIFWLSGSSSCTEASWGPGQGGHLTHNSGLDFDVSPCYTNGEQKIYAAECESGSHLQIDEKILAAHVIGRLGGAILKHGTAIDGVPYHYHIRFPG